MMAEAQFDIEQLLRNALAPVEPSASLSERLDTRLTELTAVAFDELADWELAAMRDPRNWGRPAAAVVIGGTAAAALVLVRAQRRSKKQGHPLRSLEQGWLDVSAEIERRLRRQR
jgi:hypothetical protein